MQTKSFLGLDVHKETITVSVAENGRNGAVRFGPIKWHQLLGRLLKFYQRAA
jgi:hypothetical protein